MVVLLHVTPLHTILSRYLTLHRTHQGIHNILMQ